MTALEFLRQFKLGQFAIFDIVVSYLGIYLLAPILKKLFQLFHIKTTTLVWMWFTLPLSIVFHVLFSQNTALLKLFLSPNEIVAKFIIIGMILLGVWEVKKANKKI